MIKQYMAIHNEQDGTTNLSRSVLNQFLDVININYKFNIKQEINESEFFDELTPKLKQRLLHAITMREKIIFKNLFYDSDREYTMPEDMI